MTFVPDRIEDFLAIYAGSYAQICEQPGCLHLELMENVKRHNVMMTYSIWKSEEALNAYRATDFFKKTWAQTKALFADEPVVGSFRTLEVGQPNVGDAP